MDKFIYPEPQAVRSGSKVSWSYYKDLEEAIQASRMAEKEAEHLSRHGYDFGYQCPGNINFIRDGEYKNMYEVTMP